jgi:hypothetical protein
LRRARLPPRSPPRLPRLRRRQEESADEAAEKDTAAAREPYNQKHACVCSTKLASSSGVDITGSVHATDSYVLYQID